MIVALFEDQGERYDNIKNCLIGYAIRRDVELDLLSFKDKNAAATFKKYADSISIAFVSLNSDDNVEIGRKMAILNPYCVVCFYSQYNRELASVLHTRLYDFFVWKEGEDLKYRFDKIMDALIEASIQTKAVFIYHARRESFYLPLKDIVYFQSDLKYVNIRFSSDYRIPPSAVRLKPARLYTKLSTIESELAQQGLRLRFTRTHQSFLVNMEHIIELNKAKRVICLTTGEELPISEACYKNVQEAVRSFKSPCRNNDDWDSKYDSS